MLEPLKDRTWPEILYWLIEHYKWEPQHLRGSTQEFRARARRQEVPLNAMFCIFACLITPKLFSCILNGIGLPDTAEIGGNYQLKDLTDVGFTQPDVVIESRDIRILIELKIDANIKAQQVEKYILLHAYLDELFGQKKAMLLFLTQHDFQRHWSPRKEAAGFSSLQTFLDGISVDAKLQARAKSIGLKKNINICDRYKQVKSTIQFHSITWNWFGNYLKVLGSRHEITDSDRRIIVDFVQDIEHRQLQAQSA